MKEEENVIGMVTDRELVDCLAKGEDLSKVKVKKYMEAYFRWAESLLAG
ncbi:MAG: hypothetical protein QXL78_06925 [Methanocellales archaeon]